ncbi:TPA: RusA family crossover junction endodeoxyribonuclease [Stenotrophomonas maltophilia]
MSLVILPWPPSVNRYWRTFRGRMLISADGRTYRQAAVGAALAGDRFGAAKVRVSIDAWLPDNRRRDVDNILKAPLDALCHAGIYDDDSQIVELSIRRAGLDKANPRLEITLEAA